MAYHAWPVTPTTATEDGAGPPFIEEKPNIYAKTERMRDPRAAVIGEAARRIATANPTLHVETLIGERGYLTAMLVETLAEMVLEGRPRLK